MMNFNQISEKISASGFLRNTVARKMYDDAGNLQKVYDFEHRKRLDMFSVYTDENDAQFKQCLQDLRATHWTQETEELRNRWMQTPEDMDRIRKNVQIIK